MFRTDILQVFYPYLESCIVSSFGLELKKISVNLTYIEWQKITFFFPPTDFPLMQYISNVKNLDRYKSVKING